MSLLELSSGVFLAAHHVDALEVSCSVDQVPNLVKKPASGDSTKKGSKSGRRDHRTATMVCDLEAKLDLDKRQGERLNDKGERDTGWSWTASGDGCQPVRLLPTVPRKGQAFALETEDWLLMVCPFRTIRPRFSFQLRSDFLLEVGASAAYGQVVRWWGENIRPILVGMPEGEAPTWRISRVDLAADVAGAGLLATDLDHLTTRSRLRKERHSSQEATGRHIGRRFTGFEIGRRGAPFYARIYDKTYEAGEQSSIRRVWEGNGYRAEEHGETIWRVEFELRSELLREMLREDGSRLSDDPGRTIREDLDGLWRHSVSDRLSFKERTGGARVERKPVRDWWRRLSEIDERISLSGHPGTKFERKAVISNDTEKFLTASLRSLATVGHLKGTPSFSDCLITLKDFYEASDGSAGFAEMIARAEARRDPSLKSSKQAISIRAAELVGSEGTRPDPEPVPVRFSSPTFRRKLLVRASSTLSKRFRAAKATKH